jgi:putative peptidoglycan lipid II flippase
VTDEQHPEQEVIRPRTVDPGGPGPDTPVLRPRTMPAMGQPQPLPPLGPPVAPVDPSTRAPASTSPAAAGVAPPGTAGTEAAAEPEPTSPPAAPAPTAAGPDLVDDLDDDLFVASPPPSPPVRPIEHDLVDDLPRAALDTGTTKLVAAVEHAEVTARDAARGEGADDSLLQDTGQVLLDTDQVLIVAAPDPALDEATRGPDPVQDGGQTPRGMLRNNLFVASGTAVSRLTGLVRTTLVFTLLVGGLADAFNNANNTPNMIYELILGGVLTATLVPLFTDDLAKGGRTGATEAIIATAVVALLAVTVIAFVAAPLLILLLSTGSDDLARDDYVHVGVRLALLFAPQVFFYGLMAVWSAVLNARHRFLAAAWAPVLNNLIAIATLLVVWRTVGNYPSMADAVSDSRIILGLGLGTTAGIVVMALSLYPSVRRSGVKLSFRPQFRHPAVQKAMRLSGWTFGYVIANLVAANVMQILAKPGSDDPTKYTTAYQFFQLPHGLLAVSIMVTFEPLLGRADSLGDRKQFNQHLLLGFRLIGLMVIPAAVGYLALPLGLEHRTFVGSDTVERYFSMVGIVAAFAVGLPGFSSYLYTLRGFYAMKNTRTPFFINLFENAVNIATAIVFVRWWGVVGLALSFSVAYTVAALVAQVVLQRHSPGFDWRGLVSTWIKLLVAAGVMGGVVYGLVRALAPGSLLAVLPTVLAGVGVGGVVYFVTILVIRVQGIDELFRRLPGLRRFSRA